MCNVNHLDEALSKQELWVEVYAQMMHEL